MDGRCPGGEASQLRLPRRGKGKDAMLLVPLLLVVVVVFSRVVRNYMGKTGCVHGCIDVFRDSWFQGLVVMDFT